MSIVSPSTNTRTILCILIEAYAYLYLDLYIEHIAYLYMQPLSPPALYTANTASLNRAGAQILRK